MDFITFNKEDQLALVTFNRPQIYNCVNRQLALELQAVLDDCRDDDHVRAVYLTGSGKAFCTGQDLQEITGPDSPSFSNILLEQFNPIITRLRALEKPVLCGVNGVAAGAGVSIALACDIVVAAESASFIQAFCKIGLVPDSGATFLLPRLVGWQRAAAMMLLGEPVSARQAVDMGMIFKVFPEEAFAEEARKMADQLARMPTRALAMTKQALHASISCRELEQQLALEEHLQTAAGQTEDFQEGTTAFREKRKPVYRGA